MEIADYFAAEIKVLGNECCIDWQSSSSKIIWNGHKNKSSKVVGHTNEDSKRSYIWAEEITYRQDGETFTYPYVSFKNMRTSIKQPGRKFHALRLLYDVYGEYKSTRTLPKKKIQRSLEELEALRHQAEIEEKALLARQHRVQKREPMLFAKMLPLANKRMFSPYHSE